MTPFDIPFGFMVLWLFMLGAVVGSFLNVCVHRIPQHRRLKHQLQGLWSPPSRCPTCGTRIQIRDNLPIVGWILLKGRCRTCRSAISVRYPIVELCNALLFVFVYWMEVPAGLSSTIHESGGYSPIGPQLIDGWSQTAMLNWRYVFHMVMIESLLVASLIDIELRIIPDATTVPAMLVAFVMATAIGQVYLVPVWFQGPRVADIWNLVLPGLGDVFQGDAVGWARRNPHLHGVLFSLVGWTVGGGMIWGVRLVGRWVLKREAMGFGDVILMAMIGAFLGWQPTIVAFFVAPLVALVVVAGSWVFRRQREIPYGPYLGLAATIVAISWRHIGRYAEDVFQQGPLIPLMCVIMFAMLYVTLQFMQLIKRLLGIPLVPEPEWEERWTSADQLAYFAGETVDDQQGQWKTAHWPGTDAARGLAEERSWLGDAAAGGPSGFQPAWGHWSSNLQSEGGSDLTGPHSGGLDNSSPGIVNPEGPGTSSDSSTGGLHES